MRPFSHDKLHLLLLFLVVPVVVSDEHKFSCVLSFGAELLCSSPRLFDNMRNGFTSVRGFLAVFFGILEMVLHACLEQAEHEMCDSLCPLLPVFLSRPVTGGHERQLDRHLF